MITRPTETVQFSCVSGAGCDPEPPLANNRRAYRLYPEHFTALQERNIPSQLLVFPDENHWVLGAKNSLQWHETVFAWLDRWLKEDGEADE